MHRPCGFPTIERPALILLNRLPGLPYTPWERVGRSRPAPARATYVTSRRGETDSMENEKSQRPYALRLVIDGKERNVTYEELALSNNLAQEALVRLLIRKKIIDAQELLDEINTVKTERYRVDPGTATPE